MLKAFYCEQSHKFYCSFLDLHNAYMRAARGNPQMVSKDNITERTSFRPLSTTGQPLPQIISIFFFGTYAHCKSSKCWFYDYKLLKKIATLFTEAAIRGHISLVVYFGDKWQCVFVHTHILT